MELNSSTNDLKSYNSRGLILLFAYNLNNTTRSNDYNSIIDLFVQLGFEVICKLNLTDEEVLECCATISKLERLQSIDSFFVITTSTYYEVNNKSSLHRRGTTLSDFNIIKFFSESDCPYLIGKPKIFIFIASGSTSLSVHDDYMYGDISNAIIFTAISDDDLVRSVSKLNSESSWVIQTICYIFSRFSIELDILELFQKISSYLEDTYDKCHRTTCITLLGFNKKYYI